MKLDHEKCRNLVCALCFKKTKSAKRIGDQWKKTIVSYFLPTYNEKDKKYPRVLCGGCYLAVYRKSKGNWNVICLLSNYLLFMHLLKQGLEHRDVNVHDYNKDTSITTRKKSGNAEHSCAICSVARANLLSKPITARSPDKNESPQEVPKVMKVCSECFSVIHPGKPHRCSKQTKIENLSKMAGAMLKVSLPNLCALKLPRKTT